MSKDVQNGGGREVVARVQIGARMEKKMVKILKAQAEFMDMSLGELLESIVLHAFEPVPPDADIGEGLVSWCPLTRAEFEALQGLNLSGRLIGLFL